MGLRYRGDAIVSGGEKDGEGEREREVESRVIELQRGERRREAAMMAEESKVKVIGIQSSVHLADVTSTSEHPASHPIPARRAASEIIPVRVYRDS